MSLWPYQFRSCRRRLKLFLKPVGVTAIVAVLCGGTFAVLTFERAWPFARGTADRASKSGSAAPVAAGWTCPMHSFVREPHPGHCPICGMTLVPVSAESPAAPETKGAVDDSPLIRHLGLRVAEVTREPLSRDIRTYGIVTLADDSVVNLSPKTFLTFDASNWYKFSSNPAPLTPSGTLPFNSGKASRISSIADW